MQVAFYKGKKRLFNRLTAWWLRGLYSHCELVLGYEADGRAICVASSFLDGGVRQKGLATLTPFVAPLAPQHGKATAYVCVNYACRLPTTDRAAFAAQLDERPAPAGERVR